MYPVIRKESQKMTTNKAPALDLAQLIAKAVTREGEPKEHDFAEIKPEDPEPLGVVPMHLRHLYDAVEEMYEEVLATDDSSLYDAYKLMVYVLTKSLYQNLEKAAGYGSLRLCKDWVVMPGSVKSAEPLGGGMMVVGVGGASAADFLKAIFGEEGM